MTEESRMSIMAAKIANIIMSMCELYNISIPEATDMFYESATAEMIENGVADLHCRSDKYLATLVWEEHQNKSDRTIAGYNRYR